MSAGFDAADGDENNYGMYERVPTAAAPALCNLGDEMYSDLPQPLKTVFQVASRPRRLHLGSKYVARSLSSQRH